jgi:ketosteroid isomerase-like protein
MDTARLPVGEEARIHKLLNAWVTALRRKDVEGVVAHYEPDIVTYDLIPPLEHEGVAAYRRILEWWFSTIDGAVTYELRDVHVAAGAEVAFVRSLNHIGFKAHDGTLHDTWVRGTLGLRKIGGKWKLSHQHYSAPIDMESGKARLDMRPEAAAVNS